MKIICIGRNYKEHAKELDNPIPEKPLFFLKPDTSLLKETDFYYPDFTKNLHYECELVVKINKVGKNIQEKFAKEYYNEVGLGIDFTARDLQDKCKENSHPWEIAKAFENSAPIGYKFICLDGKEIQDLSFQLVKNGNVVQDGNTSNMLFSVDYIIAYVSQFFTLKTGDLIFTGTPKGVDSTSLGDFFEGILEGEKVLELTIK